ncbi:MAG: molybdopterin-dependent oxidoreductase [Ardenticatenaceae bacterium]|nr:molybdopterin-dependent oxidoreductase [Ardenticatenaceae bacterium]
METTINGQSYSFADDQLHPDEAAVELIRERAGLTGTKLACGGGVCGACTVLVDGQPMASCLLPAHHLDSKTVETIEAHPRQQLHPVQKAFMAHDGLQCGFCTPGFIMEGIAFYKAWRASQGTARPSREEVANALAGHVCRCGAYQGIYEAIQSACAGEFDEVDTVAAPRFEALEKVTGEAKYTVDVQFEGQLVGKILRSTQPHARVISIDSAEALDMPGVVGFADLREGKTTVHYVGQPIGAVAALDERTAAAALEKIVVQYDVLPAVIGLDEARKSTSPEAFPGRKNDVPSAAEGFTLPGRWNHNTRRGTLKISSSRAAKARRLVEQSKNASDLNLTERTYRNATQVHTALEPHAAVAKWDGAQKLDVWVSTQSVYALKSEIADHFDLDNEQVTVTSHHIGGGFGGKQGLYNETVAAITLARVTHKPVMVSCDRLEELSYTGLRNGAETTMQVVTDSSGKPEAMTMRVLGDAGIAIGTNQAGLLGLIGPSITRDLEDNNVINNTPPGVPFRGPDGPQAFWALEQTIDEAAHKHGLDPVAARRLWYPKHEIRHQLYNWVESLPTWQNRGPVGGDGSRYRRGVGIAGASWLFIYNPNTKVSVGIGPQGIYVENATQDIGNGGRTVLAQAVHDVFGIPRSEVIVRIGTSEAPIGPVAGGSQVTNSIYPPAFEAAEQVRDYLVETARRDLGLGTVEAAAGGIRHSAGFTSWTELAGQVTTHQVTIERKPERGPLGVPLRMPGPDHNPSIGLRVSQAMNVVEVEVDTLLGKIRPLRAWANIAAGKIFVPELARSQVYGGIIQGIGYALYEEKVIDSRTGHNLSMNMEEYKVPGIGDIPQMHVDFIEEGYEEIRGKGIGIAELATVGVAAAVGNAVYHATGWRPSNTPITPQDVVKGVNA